MCKSYGCPATTHPKLIAFQPWFTQSCAKRNCVKIVAWSTHPGNSECHFLDGSLHLGSPNGAVNYRFFPSFAPKQLQRQDMAPVVIHVNLDRMGHFMETDEFYRNLSLHYGRRFWHFWEEMWDLWWYYWLLFQWVFPGLLWRIVQLWLVTKSSWNSCSVCRLWILFLPKRFCFPSRGPCVGWWMVLSTLSMALPASNKKPARKADASTVLKWSNWSNSDWNLFPDCYTEIVERYHTGTSGNQFETKTSNGALDPAA